jgi:hypothetical protein
MHAVGQRQAYPPAALKMPPVREELMVLLRTFLTLEPFKSNKYMRILILVFFSLFLFNFFACTPGEEKQGSFALLPLPQQFDTDGMSRLSPEDVRTVYVGGDLQLPVRGDLLGQLDETDSKSEAQIICAINENGVLPPEGYTIVITAKQINLVGRDAPGLFYAFMTLEQLMEDAIDQNVNLPQCSIVDFPSLSYRAIHLDVKHHLEQTEYYYAMIDDLAGYKINGIIVEFEDKIAYRRQPTVGSADALTIEEWRQISDYAKERNIEISPLVQGLGHASFILKHDEYKRYRDDPESDWAFNPLDSGTYDVQFDLYLDAIEATPYGRYLHVGGDEVHTTGRGSGEPALKLQLHWLDKVSGFAEKHNRTPIFWDDMPLKFAGVYRPMFDPDMPEQAVDSIWQANEGKLIEFLDQFPKNCVYMRWNYSSPQTYGNIRAMEWFKDHGMQVMGATAGQTRWVLMPQQESNIGNIKAFAEISIDNDLNGLLLTLWDDDSPHFELYWRGIIAFAEYTWAGNRRSVEALKAAYRHREFSYALADEQYAFIDQLEGPVAFWKNALLKGNSRNYLHKRENPVEEIVIDLPDGADKGVWSEKHSERLQKAAAIRDTCARVEEKIAQSKTMPNRNIYRLEVYEQVNNLVQFSAEALLLLESYDKAKSVEEERAALERIRQLPVRFRDLRAQLEQVYSKTRKLTKPDDYILDQDHHVHLANQSISFDWQFYAEMLFLEKLDGKYSVK